MGFTKVWKMARNGWALTINGHIRSVSTVKNPEWLRAPTVAGRRRRVVPIRIYIERKERIPTCAAGGACDQPGGCGDQKRKPNR